LTGVGWRAVAGGPLVLACAVLVGAVLVGCAAGPGPSQHGRSPAATFAHRRPAPTVVIASGRIEGRTWRVVVDPGTGRLCAGESGLPQGCAGLHGLQLGSGLAALSGGDVDAHLRHPFDTFGPPVWNALFGAVQPDVTELVLRLSDGREVSLRPVAAAGKRWVGIVFRPGLDAVRAIAYSGRTELGYSVPFVGGLLRPGSYFVTWLHPGQQGPARAERYVATGGSGTKGWGALVIAGPWGYCASLEAPVADGQQEDCWPPAELRNGVTVMIRIAARAANQQWLVGSVSSPVAYLRLMLADRASIRVRATAVSGQRFYGVRVGASIVRWGAFDAAGRELYGGNGTPGTVQSAG